MIALTSDSSAYLTRQEAKDLGVVHIPLSFELDGRVYYETFNRRDGLYKRAVELAENGMFRTSQPSVDFFMRRFKRLVDYGCDVLCLTLSSKLSGTYSNAVKCAVKFGGRVRVIDTKTMAGGMYLLIKEARRLISSGCGLSDAADGVEALCEKVKTCFSVADIAALSRSGRLASVRRSMGTVLNNRPVFTFADGSITGGGVARGREEQIRRLSGCVPDGALEAVIQCYSPGDSAMKLLACLSARLGCEVSLRRIGVVLGAYLGADALGVSWIEK